MILTQVLYLLTTFQSLIGFYGYASKKYSKNKTKDPIPTTYNLCAAGYTYLIKHPLCPVKELTDNY
jgi:hypothetical protein